MAYLFKNTFPTSSTSYENKNDSVNDRLYTVYSVKIKQIELSFLYRTFTRKDINFHINTYIRHGKKLDLDFLNTEKF